MVFSTSAAQSTAVVVPCQNALSSFDDLRQESQQLAVAEGLGEGKTWKDFGAVGILSNPCSPEAQTLLEPWSKYFREHFNIDCKVTRVKGAGEEPSLQSDGVLNVAWPKCIRTQESSAYDILLATANAPNLNGDDSYPTAEQIADRFTQQQYITYFSENVKADIFTADDPEIWSNVTTWNPDWISVEERVCIDAAITARQSGA